jgi:hypothetical protein
MTACAFEVITLTEVLKALPKRGMSRIFPFLRSLAISSIYGKEDSNVWQRYHDIFIESRMKCDTLPCAKLFEKFLASGDLRHLCIWEMCGPLSIPELSTPHTRPVYRKPRSTTTIHFSTVYDPLPFTLGSSIRWVSQIPHSSDWANILHSIGRSINSTIANRTQYARTGDKSFQKYPALVEIYCSTGFYGREEFDDTTGAFSILSPGQRPKPIISLPRPLSPAEQQVMAGKLGAILQSYSRSSSDCDTDLLNWHLSSEAPMCPACRLSLKD